jgi:hypothetical protein
MEGKAVAVVEDTPRNQAAARALERCALSSPPFVFGFFLRPDALSLYCFLSNQKHPSSLFV